LEVKSKHQIQAPAFVPQGGASRRQAKSQTNSNDPNLKNLFPTLIIDVWSLFGIWDL